MGLTLLDLVSEHTQLKRVSYSKGGEWAGPCPFCGTGVNRFRVWPNDEHPHYWCRVCHRWGDSIEYLKERKSMSYHEACATLDVDPRYASEELHSELPLFMTRNEPPPKQWSESAELFCWRAERYLWTSGGESALAYLHKRGLNDDTLRHARVGLCPDWFTDSLSNWGLSTNQTFENENVKIPRGIILPWQVNNSIWKISVRRPDGSYFQSLGSSDGGLYNIDTLNPDSPAVLCESEIDALSIQQEASDLIAAIATGGTDKGKESPLRHKLKQASHLLIGFDLDEAGDEGSKYWLKMPNALRWTPWRHDINELLQQQAILVRTWVECGLRAATTQIEAPAEPEPPAVKIPIKKKQRPPWVKVNDVGLLEFCSTEKCRERAIAWRSNVSFEEAYCEKHKPANFGWEKQKQVSLVL